MRCEGRDVMGKEKKGKDGMGWKGWDRKDGIGRMG